MKRILMFLPILISSCVKVEVPKELPNYSVFGNLNPADSSIKIFVGKSYKVNQTYTIDSSAAVSFAKVYLESTTVTELIYNDKSQHYEIQNNGILKANNPYKIIAIINHDTLIANTIIPEKLDLQLKQISLNGNDLNIVVDWHKPNEGIAYYEIMGFFQDENNFFYNFKWDDEYSPILFQSNLTKGANISSPIGNIFFPKRINNPNKVKIQIQVNSYDKNFFHFKEFEKAQLNQNGINEKFGSPFILVSNVSNGLGLIGSTTSNFLEIEYEFN